jgi:uncharacterized protein (DUF1499 family)
VVFEFEIRSGPCCKVDAYFKFTTLVTVRLRQRMNPNADTPPTAFASWSLRIALFVVQLTLLAVVLHRLGPMQTSLLLNILAVTIASACIAILMGLAAFAVIWRRGVSGAGRAMAGILLSLGLLAWPTFNLPAFTSLPMINDITTDTTSPPAFAVLAGTRAGLALQVAYPGRVTAELQAKAYPDLRALQLTRSTGEVFELVRQAVRRLGYSVVSDRPPTSRAGGIGIIEAVDRTLVLGFRDDIVIRVQGDRRSARIDMRSASRYGSHDLGRNAARVRELLREVKARADATISAPEPVRPKAKPTPKKKPRRRRYRRRRDRRR